MNKKIGAKILAMLLLVNTANSFAADIVFDPTNFVRNTVTAAQSIKQTALEAQQLATQIQQYQMLLQSMKALDPSVVGDMISRGILPPGAYDSVGDVIGSTNGVYASAQGIMNAMSGMDQIYSQYGQVMGDLERESIATGMPVENVMKYHYNQAKAGRTQGRNQYLELQRLSSNLSMYQERQEGIRKTLMEMGAAPTLVQLMHLNAAQNDLVNDQMTHLIQVGTINADMMNRNNMKADEAAIYEKYSRDRAKDVKAQFDNYFKTQH